MRESDLDGKDLLIYLSEKKSPGLCGVVELLATLFGFSGIGVMLAGNVGMGLAFLFGYWFWLGFWACLGFVTLGIGFLPAVVAVPLWWIMTVIVAINSAQSHNRMLIRRLG